MIPDSGAIAEIPKRNFFYPGSGCQIDFSRDTSFFRHHLDAVRLGFSIKHRSKVITSDVQDSMRPRKGIGLRRTPVSKYIGYD